MSKRKETHHKSLHSQNSEVPSFLKEYLVAEYIPEHLLWELDQVSDFVNQQLEGSIPNVNGLVLAGGRSVRMKQDKTQIHYHGIAQKDYMYDLLKDQLDSVFYSIRYDQKNDDNNQLISDCFVDLGPFGAILSAMMYDLTRAWLVVASDQPFITKDTIKTLLDKRSPSKLATAFYNPETDYPEPLITIWEPRAYPVLLGDLQKGYSSPRKVLINTDIELVKLEDSSPLKNVNTPEEFKKAKKMLK